MKLVSSLRYVRNGVIAAASYDRLYVELIADGFSMVQKTIYRRELVSPMFKEPSSIYHEIIKSVEADDKAELYLDIVSKQLIDDICEANILIY